MEQNEEIIRLRENIVSLQEKLAAQKEAVDIALRAAERRFDSVNEFRQTLTDQAKTFMTIKEAEAKFESIHDKIDTINISLTMLVGQKSGAMLIWGFITAGLGVLFGLFALFGKSKP